MPVATAPTPLPLPPPPPLLWDVFCRVIDNHGDLGVCWRLSRQLGALGHRVRLWVDDASALAWMAPHGAPGVHVLPWADTLRPSPPPGRPPADVWVEAFGCEIETEFIADYAYSISAKGIKDINFPVWVNLEYLSAEGYVRRCHGLPSPVMHGPARGSTKHFFYPGFTEGTGGLLREPDWAARQSRFDRSGWLAAQGIAWQGEHLISLFCYEPPALAGWLRHLAQSNRPTLLLVAAGRPAAAVDQALRTLDGAERQQAGALRVHHMPALTQMAFDELLWACDTNFVRGEDSLVRALWAGKPFIWHIYPQDDGAHLPKLHAFLDALQAPADVRAAHLSWNHTDPATAFALPAHDAHRACVQQARQRLLALPDLTSQLVQHVAAQRAALQARTPGG